MSVDDGAFANKLKISGTNADAVIQLFTGLSDAPHLVRIRPNTAFSNFNTWTFETGNMFSVTGVAPAVTFPLMGTKWMITDASFPGLHTHSVFARPAGANVTPANNDISNQAAQGTGGAIKIRAQCSDIWVFTADTEAYISVDGAAMTQVTLTSLSTFRAWKKITTGLDSTAAHDYLISCGSSTSSVTPPLGIMIGGAGSSYSAIPATKKVIQYGDSITATFGNYAGQTAAIGAIYKVGASRGFIGANCGISGQNAAGLDSSLATIRAYRGIVEDVAIIAIGRNDGGTASAAFKTSVTNVINALLTAGVPKIIVRGQNFGGAPGTPVGGVVNRDQDLIDAVAALANANVVYVSPTTWTTILGVTPNTGAGDGTHPYTNVGTAALAAYEITSYAATGFV
ncbi:hypothetical protein CQ14_30955 [Bradyrhizobium lablabi]|uniref:SGNH hydrolase-type esterase domain-containing protein n=1 Tax=Bradyrhizobium lablabi TaxID=722472 RepID=A0A0R3MX63_9BRAD|nr:hypothetical protein CQ14_30955 [Bradyrhizobium lablabi]